MNANDDMNPPLLVAVEKFGIERVSLWVAVDIYQRTLRVFPPKLNNQICIQFIREELDILYQELDNIPEDREDSTFISNVLFSLSEYEKGNGYIGASTEITECDIRFPGGPIAFLNALVNSIKNIDSHWDIEAMHFHSQVVYSFAWFCGTLVSGCQFDMNKINTINKLMVETSQHIDEVIGLK